MENLSEQEQRLFFCKSRNENALGKFQKGYLTEEELLGERQQVLADVMRSCRISDEERLELEQACGLEREETIYYPPDLGFDLPVHGGLYTFRKLGEVRKLLESPEPVGKEFILKLQLPCSEKKVSAEVNLSFAVYDMAEGKDNYAGWKEYRGAGHFAGYHGEGQLYLRFSESEENGVESVLYQKCYRDFSDPAWQVRKTIPEKSFRYRNVL